MSIFQKYAMVPKNNQTNKTKQNKQQELTVFLPSGTKADQIFDIDF